MAQNDNQQQENRVFKKEDAYETLGIINTWIGNMTLENYKSAVKDMDEKEMIDDLEEQIHTNSKICSLKAKWYNKGIKFLLATVILWFVCMIFQLI